MANHRSIYIGPYIELEKDYILKDVSETLDCCLNESCENEYNNISGNFCPTCGSKIYRMEKSGKVQVRLDIHKLCEEVFKNSDQFFIYDKFIFGNMNNHPGIIFDHNEDICNTFSELFETLEKYPLTDFKILSEKLNTMGYKNSIKAGIVSYWP